MLGRRLDDDPPALDGRPADLAHPATPLRADGPHPAPGNEPAIAGPDPVRPDAEARGISPLLAHAPKQLRDGAHSRNPDGRADHAKEEQPERRAAATSLEDGQECRHGNPDEGD